VLRADAGPAVGLGHLRRCLALVTAFAPWADCRMLLCADDTALADVRALAVVADAVAPEREATLEVVESLGAQVLVVDTYTWTPDDLREAGGRVPLLVAIDDMGEFPLPAHLVINSAPGVRRPAQDPDGYLLGPTYALLAPEFAAPPERDWEADVERVLITLGGAPPVGLMGAVATAARRAMPDVALDVVIGPGADRLLVNRALRPVGNVTVHQAPRDMRALMLNADVAISAGGVTVLELAATAMPIIAMALAQNQQANLLGMADAKALLFATSALDGRLPAMVGGAARALAGDRNRRRTLGERARRLVDGAGAARAAEAIRARLASAELRR
jgi:UDP-2,4-diacetamido-2,4,6-trideoxy-beta-L-altropyranose hydrolase